MNINIQAAEIARIADMLAPLCGDDERAYLDTLTGETRLEQIMAILAEERARAKENITGIKARRDELAVRLKRMEAKDDALAKAQGMMLRAAKLPKFELPECTISVRDGKPRIDIIDAAAVPEGYCRIKLEPNKALINEDFADAAELPNWLQKTEAIDIVTVRSR